MPRKTGHPPQQCPWCKCTFVPKVKGRIYCGRSCHLAAMKAHGKLLKGRVV